MQRLLDKLLTVSPWLSTTTTGANPSTLEDRANRLKVEAQGPDGLVRFFIQSLRRSIGVTDGFNAGLVTDYGSSLVQWMRTRRPRYKGGHGMEVERPSASYMVDVGIVQRC